MRDVGGGECLRAVARRAPDDRGGIHRAASAGSAPVNVDFARFDPVPVGPLRRRQRVRHLRPGRQRMGMDGDVFAPFDGFTPLPSYPEYSADFFDGDHFVMKGASPVTARGLIRPGFRNWFRPRYSVHLRGVPVREDRRRQSAFASELAARARARTGGRFRRSISTTSSGRRCSRRSTKLPWCRSRARRPRCWLATRAISSGPWGGARRSPSWGAAAATRWRCSSGRRASRFRSFS